MKKNTFGLCVAILMSAGLYAAAHGAGTQSADAARTVTAQTPDGLLVCNISGAVSQVPGRPDYFIGRGWGIGTLDYCHNPTDHPVPFLAVYKMDWNHGQLTMQDYLLKVPVTTPNGFVIRKAYDPFVAQFRDQLWVAFECTVPDAVSSCIAPLAADLKSLDLSRLTVPVLGTLGPHGANKQIVGLLSASAPTLLPYGGKLYIYWQVDPFDNALPKNILVTRGMSLDEDPQGRLWGSGSGGKPVPTDDPRLTVLVHDVNLHDDNSNHVALTTDIVIVDHKLFEIASVGGTAGPEVCRSTHDHSPGCWRLSLSVSTAPLGLNVFGKTLLPTSKLPANIIEYPRMIVDPTGRHFLLGLFEPPKMPALSDRKPPIDTRGLAYIPFEPSDYLGITSP